MEILQFVMLLFGIILFTVGICLLVLCISGSYLLIRDHINGTDKIQPKMMAFYVFGVPFWLIIGIVLTHCGIEMTIS